jgi:hypothetical protein
MRHQALRELVVRIQYLVRLQAPAAVAVDLEVLQQTLSLAVLVAVLAVTVISQVARAIHHQLHQLKVLRAEML